MSKNTEQLDRQAPVPAKMQANIPAAIGPTAQSPPQAEVPGKKHRWWMWVVIVIALFVLAPQLIFWGPTLFMGWGGSDQRKEDAAVDTAIKDVGFQGVLQETPPAAEPVSYKMTKDYTVATVFAYGTEPVPEYVIDILCDPNAKDSKSYNYVPTWYREQAKKYQVNFNLRHECFKQQIQLPDKFIWDASKGQPLTCSNGRSEPILRTDELIQYVKDSNPALKNYNFLNITFLANPADSVKDYCDFARVKANTTFMFLQKKLEATDEYAYYPSPFSRFLPAIFAHELAHLLGATDKYTNDNDCTIDKVTGQKYSSLDIMCHSNSLKSDPNYQAIITDPTAREFGWL